jgi:deoxyribonuclease-1
MAPYRTAHTDDENMKRLAFLIIALALTLNSAGSAKIQIQGNSRNTSFNKAKKILMRQVYYDHYTTFYCGCEFSSRRQVFHTNGYKSKKKWRRAHRLEWEHIVPAHAFGRSFRQWREGHADCVDSKGKAFKGRNCARKMIPMFRYMESDLYNLVPAVGEINGLRSNYSFAIIPGEKREFGRCDIEIAARKAEPPEHVRGNIARIYKYMNAAYPGRGITSKKNRKLFNAWDRQDPVDAWECQRTKRIENIQGNTNPFVRPACVEKGLWSQMK